MTTSPPAIAPKVITPCQGNGVLAVLALVDGRPEIAYPACPGCDECSTESRLARLAAAPPAADPFAGIPTDTDERF